jgi:hypothetical protein
LKDLTYITEHHFDARWRSQAAAVNVISSQLEKMIAAFEQLHDTWPNPFIYMCHSLREILDKFGI